MNNKQKQLLIGSLVAVAVAMIFPPWTARPPGLIYIPDPTRVTIWQFLFDPPRDASIAIGPLALTLLLIGITTGAGWIFLGTAKSERIDSRRSEQDEKRTWSERIDARRSEQDEKRT